MANSDPLTELPNSRAAMSELELIHSQSHRAGRNYTILFIDGDNLRQYNEISYAAGDEMIQMLSAVQSQALRGRDFLARWRLGDEFVVILPDTPLELALGIAERMRSAVEVESQGWLIPVTISIGAAEYPGHADSITALLNEAEEAKNQAKIKSFFNSLWFNALMSILAVVGLVYNVIVQSYVLAIIWLVITFFFLRVVVIATREKR